MSDDDKQVSQGFEAQSTVPATAPVDAGADAVSNKAPPVGAKLDDNQSLDPGNVSAAQRNRNPILDEQEELDELDEANELEPEETLSVGLTQEVQDLSLSHIS